MFFYFFIFIVSFVLTYAIKQVSIKKALLDIPNDRSSHTIPTPHGGGIAIALTWFIGISYLFDIDQIEADLFYALMVGAMISLVSYLDDLYELNLKFRVAAQLFSALAGLWFLGGMSVLDFGLFTIENQILTNTIAIIAITMIDAAVFFVFMFIFSFCVTRELLAQAHRFFRTCLRVVRCSIPHIRGNAYMENTAT